MKLEDLQLNIKTLLEEYQDTISPDRFNRDFDNLEGLIVGLCWVLNKSLEDQKQLRSELEHFKQEYERTKPAFVL
ncbi:MAG TPA: hypothetical protein V6C58_21675 [Allocoleopsis sp.]